MEPAGGDREDAAAGGLDDVGLVDAGLLHVGGGVLLVLDGAVGAAGAVVGTGAPGVISRGPVVGEVGARIGGPAPVPLAA